MVVDSCQTSGATQPAALEYLRGIGVDVASQVTIIVATHWHDDHVRGISKLFMAATSAKFYHSAALNSAEFAALISKSPTSYASKFTSGVAEFARVCAIADERAKQGGHTRNEVMSAKRLLLARDMPVHEVWALSPSSRDIEISRQRLGALISSQDPGMRRVPALEPNETSVALLLKTCAGDILLGADLEHFPALRDRGWHAVRDNEGHPTSDARVYKVAHHGSQGADCPEVWEHMVSESVISVVTPFRNGSVDLPTKRDRERIISHSAETLLTSTRLMPEQKRDRVTSRAIAEATRNFGPSGYSLGHIQLRNSGNDWLIAGGPPSATL